MKRFAFMACVCALMVLGCAKWSSADGPGDCINIATDKGPVTGVDNKGVCEYKGIPFAAPPVGELRFRLPQPHAPWTAPLVADKFSAECYQTPMVAVLGKDNPTGSEDCLYLNVWASQKAAAEKKPVMMFLHGGGFEHGSGIMDTYHGARMAATGDVVVVTINYRLGPFGFFMHPALTEPDGSLEGNYGIYDQVAALKWIQTNIASFGGDPGNVTIFGESAGGMSVGMLLISPLTDGMFHRAIIESGPVFIIGKTIKDMLPVGEAMAEDFGCKDPATVAACLRAAPASDILLNLKTGLMFLSDPNSKKKKFPAEPLAGGKLIPDTPLAMFMSGRYKKDIPVIIGSNRDEFSFFMQSKKLGTREQFDAAVAEDIKKMQDIFGVNVFSDELLKFYDPDNYETPKKAYADLMGDMAFTCPTRSLANIMAGHGTPVYLYHFVHVPEGVSMLGDLGAFHGSELPFVFGNMTFLGIKFPSSNNKKVSKKILGLWTGFAHTGVPSFEDAPAWPPYDADKQSYMKLELDMAAGTGFKKDRCAVFEQYLSTVFK